MATVENPITFVLVEGCWLMPEIWDATRYEIRNQGHESVTTELPAHDPEATFDDHAQVVADRCRTENNVIIVGHSRAGNVIPRAAGIVAVEGLIFLDASFQAATLAALGKPGSDELDKIPPRNPIDYHQAILQRQDGLTDIDPGIARELFCNDCTETDQDWLVDHLRPQRRSDDEPVMERWPDVPQHAIFSEQDLVTNPDWSRYVFPNWLGINPKPIPGGHLPMLSRPEQLAKTLIALGGSHAEQ